MTRVSLYGNGSSRIEPEKLLARPRCLNQTKLDTVNCVKFPKEIYSKGFFSIIDERLGSAAEEAEFRRHSIHEQKMNLLGCLLTKDLRKAGRK